MKDKKLTRKEALEELTRKDILDSTVTILLKNGINHLTMDLVAAEAGIAKGTLYLHYKSKKQLLDSVVAYCYEPMDEVYDEILKSNYDPVARLEKFVFESLKFAENNKKIFNEVKTIMYNTLYQAFGDKKSWYWDTVSMFSKILDEGIESGIFKRMNSEKAAVVITEIINSFMSHRILLKVKETIEDDTREIMNLFLKGIIKK